MRTDDEIVARIEEISSGDWMGTQRYDLIKALSWEGAQPFLSEEGKALGAEEWENERLIHPEKVAARMHEYLPFAIGKAEDHRGISAGRSIDHFRAWAWLLGDEEYAKVDWDEFAQYGAPILKEIAGLTGFPWPVDNEPLNRMAAGDYCEPDCMEGCGA